MKKSSLIIIAIIVIVILALVFFRVGFRAGKESLEEKISQYKKVIDYYFPILEEKFSVSGKIIKIQDKVLNVETFIEDPYVLPEERQAKIVKVNITEQTRITKFDIDTGELIEIALSELELNNEISARAEENIKDKDEFTADSIELFETPE